MKHLIKSALLSIALPFFAADLAAAQTPYNRGITNVEVSPSPLHGPGFFDLSVGLIFSATDSAPFDANRQLDLSTSIEVFVDGVFWSTTPLLVRMANGDNDYPTCDTWQPCDGDCGDTVVGPDSYSNNCVPPYINGGTGPCMCTSFAAAGAPNVYVDPNGTGNITVQLVSAAQELAEFYTDDDSLTFPFIGVNYCVSNTNSTGDPALISAMGSRSVQTNNLRLEASPLPTNQFGIFYYGPTQMQAPFGDGYRCVSGQTFRLPVTSAGSAGVLSTQLDLANPSEPGAQITPGSTHFFQAWYRDPNGGPVGFNLSDGYMITFIP
ncbi:MAG: hypothetical protein ACI841_001129 [Planctomycetota bacterium]|jgi:hypothetical protein